MITDWTLTCLCENDLLDIVLDIHDHSCSWRDEQGEIYLSLEKTDIWWIADGRAIGLERQPLRLHTLYPCIVKGQKAYLFCAPQDQKSNIFTLYRLDKHHRYTIGRSGCDITYDHDLVSQIHADLIYEQEGWMMKDHQSVNGVYHNRKRQLSAPLKFGDSLYILGMWVIIGDDWIAINNPLQRCIVHLHAFEKSIPIVMHQEAKKAINFRTTLKPYHIKTYAVNAPPSMDLQEKAPLLYQLGPSITMGFATLGSAVFMAYQSYAQNGSLQAAFPSMLMAVSMMLGTMVWPYVLHRYEKAKQKQKEQNRKMIYETYLQNLQMDINKDVDRYRQWLIAYFPNRCDEIILWQKQHVEISEYICLGYGDYVVNIPWENEHSRQISIIDDPLEQKKQAFMKQTWRISSIPYLLHMHEHPFFSVLGARHMCVAYGRYIMFQICNTYEPNQIRLLFACPNTGFEFHDLRFLPHLYHHGKRYLCEDNQEAYRILQDLHDCTLPIVLISFLPSCTQIFTKSLYLHPHMLIFGMHESDSAQPIYVNEDCQGSFQQNMFTWQYIKSESFFNLCSDPQDKQNEFPSTLSFLRLFNVSRYAHLDIKRRWQMADTIQSLRVPVGVYENGEVCYLDVHEKAHGPHGILAGMTGSGKSEFILTFLLSLAVTYPPNDVSFVLIDYKGGGMAKTLEHLPHTVGMITNLDQTSMKRCLFALQSECTRRQHMFSKCMDQAFISSMDIHAYAIYQKEHPELEPMPHLLIVADEFAELKHQFPDIIEQLIRLARIGRSMGIHLVLATQKPSGVVDDQIWSNAHFHICMKVAEKSDSMDMLKRDDAAYLTACGRYYLQVGMNEVFETGQSAFTRSLYDTLEVFEPAWIHQIDAQGNPKAKWMRNIPKNRCTTELQLVLQEIEHIVKQQGLKTQPLWLPPLIKKCIDQPSEIGIIAYGDDPKRQRQFPITLPLLSYHNTVMFANDLFECANAIKTMLYAFCLQHDHMQIKIVIIDFRNGELQEAYHIPQVYGFAKEANVDDIEYMMHWLMEELQERKKGPKKQKILLVIHHYVKFHECFSELEDIFYTLLSDGYSYGIYILLSTQSPNDLRQRYLIQFANRISFRLANEHDYQDVLGYSERLPLTKGCAYQKHDEIYEICFVEYAIHLRTSICFHPNCIRLYDKMRTLPQHITMKYLNSHFQYEHPLNIPIGIRKQSRLPMYVNHTTSWLISGPQAASFLACMDLWCSFHNIDIQIQEATILRDDGMNPHANTFIYVPWMQITTFQQMQWFEKLIKQGKFLWIGKGLHEIRYLFDIRESFREVSGFDGFWIHEHIEEIRFLEEEV